MEISYWRPHAEITPEQHEKNEKVKERELKRQESYRKVKEIVQLARKEHQAHRKAEEVINKHFDTIEFEPNFHSEKQRMFMKKAQEKLKPLITKVIERADKAEQELQAAQTELAEMREKTKQLHHDIKACRFDTAALGELQQVVRETSDEIGVCSKERVALRQTVRHLTQKLTEFEQITNPNFDEPDNFDSAPTTGFDMPTKPVSAQTIDFGMPPNPVFAPRLDFQKPLKPRHRRPSTTTGG